MTESPPKNRSAQAQVGAKNGRVRKHDIAENSRVAPQDTIAHMSRREV